MLLKQSFAVVFAFLLATCTLTEAKRSWSSSSSSKSSKSRPTSHSRPSSSGTANQEHAKLSYGGQTYNTQSKPAASNAAPIGWNVPSNNKPVGPPPAYSASNPVGGAKASPYDKPPAYNPAYSPASSSNTNYNRPGASTGTAAGAAAGTHQGTPYRARQNSTGGFGGIQSSHVNNQHSSYPTQQQVPAGATYHSNVPAGATYYPSGGYPNAPGGGYHPPAGATYHPAGGMPPGASYYPSGYGGHGGGGYAPGGGYPAGGGMPPGATYYNNPSALPAGATYYPQKSSGPGFGEFLFLS